MKQCKCGSWAINPELHGRLQGDRLDLCDVCYWRNKYEILDKALNLAIEQCPSSIYDNNNEYILFDKEYFINKAKDDFKI